MIIYRKIQLFLFILKILSKKNCFPLNFFLEIKCIYKKMKNLMVHCSYNNYTWPQDYFSKNFKNTCTLLNWKKTQKSDYQNSALSIRPKRNNRKNIDFLPALRQKNEKNELCCIKIDSVETKLSVRAHTYAHTHMHTHARARTRTYTH